MKPMLKTESPQVFSLIPSFLKNSVRVKLLAVVFGILLLFGIVSVYSTYTNDVKQYNERVNKNFSLIADVLENDISRWLNSRENEVIAMAGNPLVQQYIEEISSASGNADQTVNKLVNYWKTLQEQYGIYDEIYFITPDGQILVSTDRERINTVRPRADFITKPLETGQLYFQDAYFSLKTKRPCINFSVPVSGPGTGSQSGTNYLGVLVYRVDIGEVLQPLLESRVSLGNTGEVILVNRNKIAITELRSRPGSALKYTLKSEAALRAARGEEGIQTGYGYNNKETLSVYRYLPSVKWGLIVRQETSEIFGPLYVQMLRHFLTDLLAFILILTLLYLLLNRILKPVVEMSGVAREISQGDFSKRIKVESNDEIGILGETLNSMAAELGQQFTLQQNRQEVMQSLATTLDVDELLQRGLETLCAAFDFKVGAVYLTDFEHKGLVRKALFCPGRELKERELMGIGEGLEGHAVHTREVQVITNPPEDTLYTINWLDGNILPVSIVTVPLLFGEQTLGVMSLSSQKNITPAEIEVLKTIGTVMGVTVNNALSYERTRELSVRLQELNEELSLQNEELQAQSEELQAQSEELQSQTEELQTQSEELQTITEELQAKNTELLRADEHKSKFLATLSHELRAPLNAVISFSDVLLDQVVGQLNRQQEKYLHEILNSGQHLLNLINDLLDLSKIEAGQVELDIRSTDPAAPLKEALAMVSADISRKSLEVVNLVPDSTYTISADRDKLKQVFLNLLTNAVKFTPEGGRVTVSARREQDVLYLAVADTGIGIAPQYHETIFEEFKQAKNSASGSFGGTGLGLAITRKLLTLQNGRIYVESAEGQGATFTFSLPINYETNPTGVEQKCNIKCPGKESCSDCECPRTAITYLPKPLDKAALLKHLEKVSCRMLGQPPTLLVIDDDPVVRSFVQAVLLPRGYRVVTAEDGEQGISMALSKNPDYIILDMIMPETDGFQVLDKLSTHHWERGLSVFICTSKDLSAEEKQFLEARVREIYKKRAKNR